MWQRLGQQPAAEAPGMWEWGRQEISSQGPTQPGCWVTAICRAGQSHHCHRTLPRFTFTQVSLADWWLEPPGSEEEKMEHTRQGNWVRAVFGAGREATLCWSPSPVSEAFWFLILICVEFQRASGATLGGDYRLWSTAELLWWLRFWGTVELYVTSPLWPSVFSSLEWGNEICHMRLNWEGSVTYRQCHLLSDIIFFSCPPITFHNRLIASSPALLPAPSLPCFSYSALSSDTCYCLSSHFLFFSSSSSS